MVGKDRAEFTNMCMVYDGDRVLVQNKVGNNYCGITFPGGHVESGESFTDAVIREVFEETGLSISEPRLCGLKDWTEDDGSRYIVFFYKTNKFSGQLSSSEEGEVFWVNINEMPGMNLASGMDKTLRVFLEDGLSEHCFCKENGEWIEVLK